jgi:RHS repeat-associated protein
VLVAEDSHLDVERRFRGAVDRVEFTYDGEGHRTTIVATAAAGGLTTTEFRYQGDAVVEEKVNGTVVRQFVTDESGAISKLIIPAGQTDAGTYLVTWNGHGDALNLLRVNGDGTTTLANSFTYDSWGKPTTATHNGITDLGFRYLYVGQFDVQWDNQFGLELHYMHARHYAPGLGRFLQPDPAAMESNAYAYAGNSPVTVIDPTGLCPFCVLAIIVFRAAIVAAGPQIIAAVQRLGPQLVTATQRTVPRLQRFWESVSAGRTNSQFLPRTTANLRENLSRLTGVRPGTLANAHHNFPARFWAEWNRLGIQWNDPRNASWWPSGASFAYSHQANAWLYNELWRLFLRTGPSRTSAINFARTLAKAFGLRTYF